MEWTPKMARSLFRRRGTLLSVSSRSAAEAQRRDPLADAESMGVIAAEIGRFPDVRALELDAYNTGAEADAAVEILMEAVARAQAPLSTLRITGIRFGTRGARAIAAALERLPEIEELIIICSVIGDDAIAAVLESARAHARKLNMLYLWYTGMTAEGAGMRALLAALPAFPRLREFTLSSVGLGDDGVAALLDALAPTGSETASGIQVLGLDNVDIGDTGVAALVSAIPRLGALKGLLLSNNRRITDQGAVALAAAMPAATALERLHLKRAQLTALGANALVAALSHCPRMVAQNSLSVSDIIQGDGGGNSEEIYDRIAHALRANKRRTNTARKQQAGGSATRKTARRK